MNRLILILASLAAVQVLIITTCLGHGDESSAKEDFAITQPFAHLKDADIHTLEVFESDGTSVKLVRGEGKDGAEGAFGLANKGDYPAKITEVDNLLAAIKKLSTGRIATRQEKSFTALEVADQNFNRHVVAKAKDGTALADFYLGSGKKGGSIFYRRAGANLVQHATGVEPWEFSASATAWVESQFTEIAVDDVTKVTLERADGTLQIEKSEVVQARDPALPPLKEGEEPEKDVVWTNTTAVPPQTLDNGKVEALLATLGRIYIAEPIGKGEKPEQGFEKPSAKATLQKKDGSTIVLTIGAKRDKENDWFIRKSGFDWSATVRTYTVEDAFQKKAEALLPDKKDETPAPEAGHEGHDHK
jgi:hypothetical protein